MRAPLWIGGATSLAVAAALLLAWPAEQPAGSPPGDPGTVQRTGTVAAVAPLPWVEPVEQTAAAGVHATRAPQPAAGAAPRPAHISVSAARRLLVGETGELVVGVGPYAAVGAIELTLSFDANVLQVRAGSEGNWSAGAGPARFSAELSDGEDRVRIRSAVAGRLPGNRGASVALVQFQAVAPGATSVLVSDVAVRDSAGQALPFLLSSSALQVMVESLPPAPPRPAARPWPAPGQAATAAAAAAGHEAIEEGD